MEDRREHEADPSLGQAPLDAGRVQVDPDAERLQEIGRAAQLDAARFPHATGAPAPAATMAAIVDTLIVPARSPPVPHVSSTGAGGVTGFASSSAVRASPSSSSTVSPFVRAPSGTPHLPRRDVAGHHRAHRGRGLVGREGS